MVNAVSQRPVSIESFDADMRAIEDAIGRSSAGGGAQSSKSGSDSGFMAMLKEGVGEVNRGMKASEQASMDLVSGKSSNIHETMLAASKAELGMNLLVQLRNKAIDAYQEVMRMQV